MINEGGKIGDSYFLEKEKKRGIRRALDSRV